MGVPSSTTAERSLRNWASPSDEKTPFTTVGYISTGELYFATRHPLRIKGSTSPLKALEEKVWLNYSILYILFILTSSCIYLWMFHGICVNQAVMCFISPSQPQWSHILTSGFMLPCLILFTFWTFTFSLGVDLWTALIG